MAGYGIERGALPEAELTPEEKAKLQHALQIVHEISLAVDLAESVLPENVLNAFKKFLATVKNYLLLPKAARLLAELNQIVECWETVKHDAGGSKDYGKVPVSDWIALVVSIIALCPDYRVKIAAVALIELLNDLKSTRERNLAGRAGQDLIRNSETGGNSGDKLRAANLPALTPAQAVSGEESSRNYDVSGDPAAKNMAMRLSRKLSPRNGFLIYIVLRGDSLTLIADRHHTTVEELLQANELIIDRHTLYVGEEIYIPAPIAGPATSPEVEAAIPAASPADAALAGWKQLAAQVQDLRKRVAVLEQLANSGQSARATDGKAGQKVKTQAQLWAEETKETVSQSAREHLQKVLQGMEPMAALKSLWEKLLQDVKGWLRKMFQDWAVKKISNWASGLLRSLFSPALGAAASPAFAGGFGAGLVDGLLGGITGGINVTIPVAVSGAGAKGLGLDLRDAIENSVLAVLQREIRR